VDSNEQASRRARRQSGGTAPGPPYGSGPTSPSAGSPETRRSSPMTSSRARAAADVGFQDAVPQVGGLSGRRLICRTPPDRPGAGRVAPRGCRGGVGSRHAHELPARWLGPGDDEVVRRGSRRAGRAPRRVTRGRQPAAGAGGREPRRTGAAPAPGCAPRGAKAPQGAPANGRPSACSIPERSEPAIGCPPTKRARRPRRRRRGRSSCLVLPTSVRIAPGGRPRATRGELEVSRPRQGEHTRSARETASRFVVDSSRAPGRAPCGVTGCRSMPTTRTPRKERASASPNRAAAQNPRPRSRSRNGGAGSPGSRPSEGPAEIAGRDDSELGPLSSAANCSGRSTGGRRESRLGSCAPRP